MEKKIPIYFDSVVVSSPFTEISESTPDIGRLKVRVFTKYGNRNGSYITEEVANQLIESATNKRTPVIGFFDPQSQTWASHVGPSLANAYGYVESFLGWEPFEDTDGVTRDYAVFSVILFTEYYEEAKKIYGQNQSMELDPKSIDGSWVTIEGEEYYVYTNAKMLGFCVIGEHEPCFSVSSFFSKNDDSYKNQYEKFSSLLSGLEARVEETEKKEKGGEQPMDEFKEQEEQVVKTPEVENENGSEDLKDPNFQVEENSNTEEDAGQQESEKEPSELEVLQQKFNDLQTSYNELQSQYEVIQSEYENFQTTSNTELETLRTENKKLQASLQTYEQQALEAENIRKEKLIEKYEKVIKEEEITPIRAAVKDFSYDELESKLAIAFANANITEEEPKKVPLLEQPESQFALLMKKYRKN